MSFLLLFTYFFLILVLLVLLASVFLILWEFVRLGRGDVPFVPSASAVLDAVIVANILPKQGMILDLGCGDGKALRHFARAGYAGPLIGYERAILPWLAGRFFCWMQRSPAVIRRGDFSAAPLEEACGLYLFLLSQPLERLAPILAARLQPGTPVVSAEFEIAGWTPERTITARGITSKEAKIFIYRVPSRAS